MLPPRPPSRNGERAAVAAGESVASDGGAGVLGFESDAAPAATSASAAAAAAAPARATQPTAIVVLGAGGETPYEETFAKQAGLWKDGAVRGGARLVFIGEEAAVEGAPDDLTRLKTALAAEARGGTEPLWLILLGHGTFDGRVAKFNLRGPDLTATELALDLQPFTRPLVIINAASASAPLTRQHPLRLHVLVTGSKHSTTTGWFSVCRSNRPKRTSSGNWARRHPPPRPRRVSK
jgi:hypothetical protein